MKFTITPPRSFDEFALSESCPFREDHINNKKKMEDMGFVFSKRILPNGGDSIEAEPIEVEITQLEELINLAWGDVLITGNSIDIDHIC